MVYMQEDKEVKGMARSKKKILLITLVVIIGLGIISFGVVKAMESNSKGKMYVRVAKVEEQSIESNIISTGTIMTKEQVNVISTLPYPIKEVLVGEGDKVSKGDILAVLDTQDLEYKVKVAETNLEIERKKYEDMIQGTDTFQLEKNLENAKIAYENAKEKYESSLKLYEVGAISKTQLSTDESAMITARNNFELAEKSLEDAKKGDDVEAQRKKIELEELNLKLQKETLEDSIIRSPIDGTVVLSNAKVGITGNAATPMFVIDDLNQLEIELNISEYDINEVKIGQEAKITGEAFKGKEFKGKVSYIAPSATMINTNTGRETNVKVKVDIQNVTEELKPGFTADVSICTAEKKDALVVPYETLYQKSDGTTVVFKVDDNDEIIETPVELGIEGDLYVEIKFDLIEVGDMIVINPNENLKSGIKVNILNKGEIQ